MQFNLSNRVIVGALALCMAMTSGAIWPRRPGAAGPTNYLNHDCIVYAGIYDGADGDALGVDQTGNSGDLDCGGATGYNCPASTASGLPTNSPSGDEYADFDSSNSETMVGDDSGGAFDPWETADYYTVVFWAHFDAELSAQHEILQKTSLGGKGWSIRFLDSGGNDYINLWVDGQSDSNDTGLNHGTWYHFALQFNNADNQLVIHVDAADDCSSCATASDVRTGAHNAFAGSNLGSLSLFDGGLYEVAVFSDDDDVNCTTTEATLSTAQICEICKYGLRGNVGTARTCSSCTLP